MKDYDFNKVPKEKKYLLYRHSVHEKPFRYPKAVAVILYLVLAGILAYWIFSLLDAFDKGQLFW